MAIQSMRIENIHSTAPNFKMLTNLCVDYLYAYGKRFTEILYSMNVSVSSFGLIYLINHTS